MRQALAKMAAGYSSAAVTMGHLALKRAIRHAEADNLVNRNVAALADTPKGQNGRPSKSLSSWVCRSRELVDDGGLGLAADLARVRLPSPVYPG